MDEELDDIRAACVESNKVTNPWAEILKRESRPQLFVALTATFFQQWTGINTVIFYGEQHRLLGISYTRITHTLNESTWCNEDRLLSYKQVSGAATMRTYVRIMPSFMCMSAAALCLLQVCNMPSARHRHF